MFHSHYQSGVDQDRRMHANFHDRHSLTQGRSIIHELKKMATDPFNGTSYSYWSWYGQIQ